MEKIINYKTAIHHAGRARAACYSLATDAYNSGQTKIQQKLYAIADAIQVQLSCLMEIERQAKSKVIPCRSTK